MLHYKRTGRNSVLMDGNVGLTIDTKVEDIKCLGLRVYAFWEIVKVERWWEYTVQRTEENQKSFPQLKTAGQQEHESLKKKTPSAIASKTQTLPIKEKGLDKGKLIQAVGTKSDAPEKKSREITKRRRSESEDEMSIDVKRRKQEELDAKLETMRLKNENAPSADTLKPFAERTKEELRTHDNYVSVQRKNKLRQAQALGPKKYTEMLQKFEISWERQRQDIIKRDPQFKRKPQTQTISNGSNAKAIPNKVEAQQTQKANDDKELRLRQEAIQKQLGLAKLLYPTSRITLRYPGGLNVTHLKCEICPDADIRIGLRDASDIMSTVKSHQESSNHANRVSAAMRAKRKEELKGSGRR